GPHYGHRSQKQENDMSAKDPKIDRDGEPSDMLNAAPRLYTSVNRTYSPKIRFGSSSCNECCTRSLVRTSKKTTVSAAPQNTRPFDEVRLACRCSSDLSRLARHRCGAHRRDVARE